MKEIVHFFVVALLHYYTPCVIVEYCCGSRAVFTGPRSASCGSSAGPLIGPSLLAGLVLDPPRDPSHHSTLQPAVSRTFGPSL